VSFDMADAISPVNPLDDKFLVAFTNIILEDMIEVFEFIQGIVNLQRCDSWRVIAIINTTV
jgi:hypothetical protein